MCSDCHRGNGGTIFGILLDLSCFRWLTALVGLVLRMQCCLRVLTSLDIKTHELKPRRPTSYSSNFRRDPPLERAAYMANQVPWDLGNKHPLG